MNDDERIRDRLLTHGVPVDGRDWQDTRQLGVGWFEHGRRIRAAVESVVDPAVGPITAYTHTPERTGH